MKINASAISLTVDDVGASSKFLQHYLDFEEKFNADGFAYLQHSGGGIDLVLLRTGTAVLPKYRQHQQAQGIIIAFIIDDVEAEEKQLREKGITITLPLQEDPWGERLFQVEDPNGVTYQLVQWVKPSDEHYTDNPGSQHWT